ncbi:MAG: hypothetical protein M1482_09695 [Chloroflexi bacterium]|nr:hypothetical protein [Chloroflexota bacterium]
MLTTILLGTMLVVMLMRVAAPLGQKTEGHVLDQVWLSFRERLLLQRTNIYAIGVVLVLGAVGGWVSTTFELLEILLAFAILMIPTRYVLTSEGIALNNTLFRRWDDFADYKLKGIRVHLVPRGRARAFTLFVPPGAQGEVLKIVRRKVNQ